MAELNVIFDVPEAIAEGLKTVFTNVSVASSAE